MPKQPSKPSPIRALRSIVGISQPELARTLGVAVDTVRSLEMRRLTLSDDNADRFVVEFGVLPRSIQRGGNAPEDIFGRPYSFEFYEQWRGGEQNGLIGELEEKADRKLATLQRLARENGRALSLVYLFERWLDSTIERFGLSEAFMKAESESAEQPLDPYPLCELRHNSILRFYGRTMTESQMGIERPKTPGRQKVTATPKHDATGDKGPSKKSPRKKSRSQPKAGKSTKNARHRSA